MADLIEDRLASAESEIRGGISGSHAAFQLSISKINAEAARSNTYGGSAWQEMRLARGADELRHRAQIIRETMLRLFSGLSEKQEKKFRVKVASRAVALLDAEKTTVADWAIPKSNPAGRFPGLPESALDERYRTIREGLEGSLTLPTRPPEKSIWVRIWEDRLTWAIGLLLGALVARLGDVFTLVREASCWIFSR